MKKDHNTNSNDLLDIVPDDGVLPARSLGVLEQVDTIIRLVRDNVWYLVWPIFFMVTPVLLLESVFGVNNINALDFASGFSDDASFAGGFAESLENSIFAGLSSLLVWVLVQTLYMPVVEAMLTRNSLLIISSKEPSLKPHLPSIGRFVLMKLAMFLAIWAPLILIGVVLAALFSTDIWSLSDQSFAFLIGSAGLLLLLFIPIWQFVQSFLFFAPIISMAEKLSPFNTLKRMVALFKVRFGFIIFFSLVMVWGVQQGSQGLATLPASILVVPSDYQWATEIVAQILLACVTLPVTAMGTAIAYRDLLIRAEAKDLSAQLDRLEKAGMTREY